MSDYTVDDVRTALEQSGELLVVLESDGYAGPIELHLHDTSFDEDRDEVLLSLSDGQMQFKVSSIESLTRHMQSTEEIGL